MSHFLFYPQFYFSNYSHPNGYASTLSSENAHTGKPQF